MNKLRNRKGESLIEMLVAILIFTLASVVLYSMITTATDMNAQARQKDDSNQEQMVALEMRSGTPKNGTVSIKVTSVNGTVKTMGPVRVLLYGEANGLYAYYPE